MTANALTRLKPAQGGAVTLPAASHHFVAMTGDKPYLRAVRELRAPPADDKVETAAAFAVEVFLNGACLTGECGEPGR